MAWSYRVGAAQATGSAMVKMMVANSRVHTVQIDTITQSKQVVMKKEKKTTSMRNNVLEPPN